MRAWEPVLGWVRPGPLVVISAPVKWTPLAGSPEELGARNRTDRSTSTDRAGEADGALFRPRAAPGDPLPGVPNRA